MANHAHVEIGPSAQREIRKLPRHAQKSVINALASLEKIPRPSGVEKLQGRPSFFRLRVGSDYRIIYHIRNSKLIIVLVIRDRKNAYKNIKSLDTKLASAVSEIEGSEMGRLLQLRR